MTQFASNEQHVWIITRWGTAYSICLSSPHSHCILWSSLFVYAVTFRWRQFAEWQGYRWKEGIVVVVAGYSFFKVRWVMAYILSNLNVIWSNICQWFVIWLLYPWHSHVCRRVISQSLSTSDPDILIILKLLYLFKGTSCGDDQHLILMLILWRMYVDDQMRSLSRTLIYSRHSLNIRIHSRKTAMSAVVVIARRLCFGFSSAGTLCVL